MNAPTQFNFSLSPSENTINKGDWWGFACGCVPHAARRTSLCLRALREKWGGSVLPFSNYKNMGGEGFCLYLRSSAVKIRGVVC